jgi:hypothetical protein
MSTRTSELGTAAEAAHWSVAGEASRPDKARSEGSAAITVVRGCERAAFLGRLVGACEFTLERTVVRAMTALAGRAALGTWEFVALRDGGGYLRPADRTYLREAPHFMSARVSADVAGIVASLFALAELRGSYRAEGIFALRYEQLHRFATQHAEAAVIFRLFEL